MTKEELVQLKEYLRNKGFRLCVLRENYKDLKDFILEKRELAIVGDKSFMTVGNGKDPISQLQERYALQRHFEKLESLEEKVKEIYHRLSRHMTVSQVKEFLYPPLWQEAFVRLKPDNFSFLEAEPLCESTHLVVKLPWMKGIIGVF